MVGGRAQEKEGMNRDSADGKHRENDFFRAKEGSISLLSSRKRTSALTSWNGFLSTTPCLPKIGGAKASIFIVMITSLSAYGAILTSMCRFYSNSGRCFPLIFPCSETTRKRCRFGAPINGTGWHRTGKCTVSRSFPPSNGCGRKATSGVLTANRETPSSLFRLSG